MFTSILLALAAVMLGWLALGETARRTLNAVYGERLPAHCVYPNHCPDCHGQKPGNARPAFAERLEGFCRLPEFLAMHLLFARIKIAQTQ